MWRRENSQLHLSSEDIVKLLFTPATDAVVWKPLAELSTPSVLIYPNRDVVTDYTGPITPYCDASVDGFGAILKQKQPNQIMSRHVIQSRATIESERH